MNPKQNLAEIVYGGIEFFLTMFLKTVSALKAISPKVVHNAFF